MIKLLQKNKKIINIFTLVLLIVGIIVFFGSRNFYNSNLYQDPITNKLLHRSYYSEYFEIKKNSIEIFLISSLIISTAIILFTIFSKWKIVNIALLGITIIINLIWIFLTIIWTSGPSFYVHVVIIVTFIFLNIYLIIWELLRGTQREDHIIYVNKITNLIIYFVFGYLFYVIVNNDIYLVSYKNLKESSDDVFKPLFNSQNSGRYNFISTLIIFMLFVPISLLYSQITKSENIKKAISFITFGVVSFILLLIVLSLIKQPYTFELTVIINSIIIIWFLLLINLYQFTMLRKDTN
ncbi:hypothetical protein [Mycoplasma crocodyli]|uniref:Putative membrane protein n=1 Tax=Mycoplasma crocodyli (strain ATCC 51981 / MP145) TaxID=512564 RepID=D5E657_MYCCM|nr:hypothetical protein [Mycoplasma crocodyli]ADE20006.1 putative membrane protein [Mycoplasma crocodyli MP145]